MALSGLNRDFRKIIIEQYDEDYYVDDMHIDQTNASGFFRTYV